jgi:hypothetical protein
MTRRSLLKRLLLSLILGVPTSVAVAWGLAYWSPWNDPRVGYASFSPRGSEVSSVLISQHWQRGMLFRSVAFGEDQPTRFDSNPPASNRQVEVLTRDQIDATWGAARRALVLSQNVSLIEEARGLPCLCLYFWKDFGTMTTGGTSLRIRGEDPWGYDFTVLPTLPIWRGLAVNTAFYGALWLIPLTLPSLVIAHRRRRRGHCPACNYNLTGSTSCPECGWNKPVVYVAAAHPGE